MAVHPIEAFLSRGTPFANIRFERETDFRKNAGLCLTTLRRDVVK
jgi:hypothetical protein